MIRSHVDPETLAQAAIDAADYWDGLAPLLTLNRAQKKTSKATKAAILLLITHKGLTPRAAALAVGMSDKSLANALAKPHIKQLRIQIEAALRKTWASSSVAEFADILHNSKNESNRMRAAEWLAGLEGIGPVKKAEITHSGPAQALGIVIVDPRKAAEMIGPPDSLSSGLASQPPEMIDVTPDSEL